MCSCSIGLLFILLTATLTSGDVIENWINTQKGAWMYYQPKPSQQHHMLNDPIEDKKALYDKKGGTIKVDKNKAAEYVVPFSWYGCKTHLHLFYDPSLKGKENKESKDKELLPGTLEQWVLQILSLDEPKFHQDDFKRLQSNWYQELRFIDKEGTGFISPRTGWVQKDRPIDIVPYPEDKPSFEWKYHFQVYTTHRKMNFLKWIQSLANYLYTKIFNVKMVLMEDASTFQCKGDKVRYPAAFLRAYINKAPDQVSIYNRWGALFPNLQNVKAAVDWIKTLSYEDVMGPLDDKNYVRKFLDKNVVAELKLGLKKQDPDDQMVQSGDIGKMGFGKVMGVLWQRGDTAKSERACKSYGGIHGEFQQKYIREKKTQEEKMLVFMKEIKLIYKNTDSMTNKYGSKHGADGAKPVLEKVYQLYANEARAQIVNYFPDYDEDANIENSLSLDGSSDIVSLFFAFIIICAIIGTCCAIFGCVCGYWSVDLQKKVHILKLSANICGLVNISVGNLILINQKYISQGSIGYCLEFEYIH